MVVAAPASLFRSIRYLHLHNEKLSISIKIYPIFISSIHFFTRYIRAGGGGGGRGGKGGGKRKVQKQEKMPQRRRA